MASKPANPIEVACPCCHSKLKVDPQLAVVLSHEAPPRSAPDVDLDDTARMLREQAEKREAKFQQSIEHEKKKHDVFDRLFEEGLKKAKDEPVTRPIRDIDLD